MVVGETPEERGPGLENWQVGSGSRPALLAPGSVTDSTYPLSIPALQHRPGRPARHRIGNGPPGL